MVSSAYSQRERQSSSTHPLRFGTRWWGSTSVGDERHTGPHVLSEFLVVQLDGLISELGEHSDEELGWR
jgi:hypothetical protein